MIVFVAAAAACAREGSGRAAPDTLATREPDVTAADSTAPGSPAASRRETWVVTVAGYGPIEAGMSLSELRRVTGDTTLSADTSSECTYVRPAALPAGVGVMLAAGHVARVDIDSGGVRTEAGVKIGDSEARVSDLYAGRVTTLPHKYVAGGHYLFVTPAASSDTIHRIVFETEANRVTRFRSGRRPEVEWVERCG